jgi:manganese efflux pump family protein
MDFLTLLLIAIGLNFDSFAVSITTGMVASHIRFWQATRIALIFALFQAFMPVAGWFVGSQVRDLVMAYDHWLAFGLLALIGVKMIIEALKKEDGKKTTDPFKTSVVIGMAVATSIDALIIGVSFAFINVNIIAAAGLIGFLTYLVAMLGMLFGKNAGRWFGRKMEIIGGIILIGIGIKILFEHLCA